MSDRQTPNPQTNTEHAASAARGAKFRDDQLAGVGNSQQLARGEPRCGGQSGAAQADDTHCLGNGQSSNPVLAAQQQRRTLNGGW